jgi:hypothetical protein
MGVDRSKWPTSGGQPYRIERPERPERAPATPPPSAGWQGHTPSGMPTDPGPTPAASRGRTGRHWDTGEQQKIIDAITAGVREVGSTSVPSARMWRVRQVVAVLRDALVIIALAWWLWTLARSGASVIPSAPETVVGLAR